MPKAQAYIYGALRAIGVLRSGQTASPEVLDDGFVLLNSMISSWNTERLMVQVIGRTELATVAGQQVYTLGPGGNWNMTRPVRIERGGVLISGSPANVEYPVDMLTVQNWAENYPTKATSSSNFTAFYPEMTFPLINVHLWPVPSSSANKFVLYAWNQIAAFADLNTTDYTFPPGYDLAIRFNLGVMLWPLMVLHSKSQANQVQFQQVESIARAEKAKIKALNQPLDEMRVDEYLTRGGSGGFNWRTGQ